MQREGKDRTDLRRRAFLRQLGLLGGAAYVAPALTSLGVARASGASGASGPSAPSRPQPRASAPSQPAPPPPELVALLPAAVAPQALIDAGYRVIAEAPTAVADRRLLRLGLPAGRGVEEARSELAGLFPGSVIDANALYTTQEMLCADGDCVAHGIVQWTAGSSDAAPRIGMIDTGVNVAHDALAGQRLTVIQAEIGDREAAGRQHGTAIAALLIGRPGSWVPGLLPNAELHAVEAFHATEDGDMADAFALAQGIEVLVAARVQVINMSFSGPANEVLRALVDRAAAEGIAMVAAAGNGGPGAEPAFPAAWPQVVGVTAVDARLRPYRQANRGSYIAFAAPGVNLWTAASIEGGRLRSGTSFAVPFVSAMLAVERARAPDRPVEEHVEKLAACAQDLGEAGYDEVFGHGLAISPDGCDASATAAMDDES